MSKKNKKHKKSAVPSKKSTNQSSIYSTIAIFAIIMITIVAFALLASGVFQSPISTPDPSINYEDKLIEDANSRAYITEEYKITDLKFDPTGMENGLYDVYINNWSERYQYQGGRLYSKEKELDNIHEQTTFVEFSKREEKIIQSSRDLVCKYIQDSSVLTNKEWLINRIQTLPFYKYTDSTHPEIISIMKAPGAHMINGIYCYDEFSEYYCEYFFVHELIHHLRYLTSGENLTTTLYYATQFAEAMTDIITTTIDPKMFNSPNYSSGYAKYYGPIYTYLSIFEEDALEAFFYGYDEFFANGGKTFEAEHNLFAVALGSYTTHPNTPMVCDALFNTWKARQF